MASLIFSVYFFLALFVVLQASPQVNTTVRILCQSLTQNNFCCTCTLVLCLPCMCIFFAVGMLAWLLNYYALLMGYVSIVFLVLLLLLH